MTFYNDDLQREIDQIESDLEELSPQSKQVKADIAKLEKILKQRGFCLPISVYSSTSREYMKNEEGSFIDTFEYVEWDKLDDEWRLIVRREEGPGDLCLGDHCHYSNTVDKTALVDSETAIQLRANLVLSEFVKQVGEALKNIKPQNSEFPDWLEEESGQERKLAINQNSEE